MTDECKKCPYGDAEQIPVIIFNDRFYTEPANLVTFCFMRHWLEHHPDDLFFLYKRAQQYIEIPNSQYKMSFRKWLIRARQGVKNYNTSTKG